MAQEINIIIDNPIYEKTNLPTLTQVLEDEEWKIEKAKKISRQKRREILANSDSKPTRTVVCQVVFNRTQYVVAEIIDRANGVCERCNKPAPFIKDNDKQPYLEVHHKIPLAEDGNDTVENVIALCPNSIDEHIMKRQHINKERKTPSNSTYPKGGVSCSKDRFVVAERSVLRVKFCGISPALRVAAKRTKRATVFLEIL